MTCKLHINLNQGLIEFEGNEEFVLSVYNDFKDKIGGTNYLVKEKTQQSKLVDKSSNSSGSTKKRTGYTLCKDLNLYKEGDKPSLQDFMQDYNANTNPQRYLLFAHYLKNIKNVETVGPNEMYTCLKKIGGVKIPNSIEQGLYDTARKKGWLDTSSAYNVEITVTGENAIDLELLKEKT